MALPIGLAGPLLLFGTLIGAGSSLNSARLIRRFSTGPVVMVSCALTGIGMLLIAHASAVGWLWAAAGVMGLGAGAVDAGINGFVARHYEARHMSWLHACWGVGATGGPFILAAALATSNEGWRTGYLIIGGVQMALAVVFLTTLSLWRQAPRVNVSAEPSDSKSERSENSPQLAANSLAGKLSVLIFAIYVGAEVTAGLWIATFLVAERGATPAWAGACSAGYYGAITVGRFLNGFVVDRWGNRATISRGLTMATLGAVLFLLPTSVPVAGLSLILIGLGIAALYPGLMHEVPRRFREEDVQIVIGRQNSAAYIGGALLPLAAAGLVQEVSLIFVPTILLGGIVATKLATRRLDQLG
ncbi:MAG: MFS transporter [Synoicihabitans sp.]